MVLTLVQTSVFDSGFRRLQQRKKLEKIHRVKAKRGVQLWSDTDYTNDDQFTCIRYTACVSAKPITFTSDGYRLQCFEKGYRVKLFIVVTMYNEDDKELVRTLRGVCGNVQHMAAVEGEGVWKKICVCIVLDGRTKANTDMLHYSAAQGFFDETLMDDALSNQSLDIRMHLFEYTTQLKQDESFEKRFPPMQIIFAMKEHNGGKLDSHLWYFNAFADQLIPKYCLLLDVGTQARDRAIFKLYRSMETNDRIAGVCGEIACDKPNYINPVVACQHFEYKISHILDKSLEASFGFISVLPGAFSAYRYDAIREKDGKGPLVDYFLSITTPMIELGAFKANMYLAEDRILCFEVISRKDEQWLLHYVKNAVAETDVPQSLDVLIRQRRRWLNGSFFASLYTIIWFNRFWNDSTHSFWRKLAISQQFLYYTLNLAMNWLLPANFYLAFYFLMAKSQLFGGPGSDKYWMAESLNIIYIFLTMAQFVMGLGNAPGEMRQMYLFSCLFYGVFSYMVFFISIEYIFTMPTTGKPCPPGITWSSKFPCTDLPFGIPGWGIKIATGFTAGCYFLVAAFHGEFAAVCLTFPSYIFMMPTFFNIFSIYSFCNIHDISWGTKGIEEEEKKPVAGGGGGAQGAVSTDAEQRKADERQAALLVERNKRNAKNMQKDKQLVEAEFKTFRSSLLMSWMASNALFSYVVGNGVRGQLCVCEPSFVLNYLTNPSSIRAECYLR